jgi:alpha-beta hydrolase superfamily lysophospholipase
MPALKEFYFPSSDGNNQIYARMWIPDGDVRGTVQIAHGIAEYINRYDDFAQFLASNGFVVAGNDHLGHGKSMGKPENQGFFADENGWDYVVRDMRALHDTVKEQYPGVPAALLGHSMGSFLARTYIIRFPDDFYAAIISGTGHQSKLLVSAGLFMARREVKKHGPRYVSQKLNDMGMGGYNKGFDAAPGETAWLSANKENVKKYDADPLCGFTATCSVFRDMMEGVKFITDQNNINMMNKKMPVYFFSGAEDPVGEKGKGVERAYNAFKKAGMEDVFMRLYPGGRHEMLNETNHEQVYKDVLDWINSKLDKLK